MAEIKRALAVPKQFRENDIAAAVVPAVSTLMGTFQTQGIDRIFVETTVAVAALTGFQIQARASDQAPYVVLYSTSADFLSPKGVLVGASGDLTTQGIGTGWFILDVRCFSQIQVYATSAGTATLALNSGGV